MRYERNGARVSIVFNDEKAAELFYEKVQLEGLGWVLATAAIWKPDASFVRNNNKRMASAITEISKHFAIELNAVIGDIVSESLYDAILTAKSLANEVDAVPGLIKLIDALKKVPMKNLPPDSPPRIEHY